MKCYKVKYLTKDEFRGQFIAYAYNITQAKALAEAYPLDGVTVIKVTQTKAKQTIDKLTTYIERYKGEDNVLKKEIESINKMRIRFGKDPIDALQVMAMR